MLVVLETRTRRLNDTKFLEKLKSCSVPTIQAKSAGCMLDLAAKTFDVGLSAFIFRLP